MVFIVYPFPRRNTIHEISSRTTAFPFPFASFSSFIIANLTKQRLFSFRSHYLRRRLHRLPRPYMMLPSPGPSMSLSTTCAMTCFRLSSKAGPPCVKPFVWICTGLARGQSINRHGDLMHHDPFSYASLSSSSLFELSAVAYLQCFLLFLLSSCALVGSRRTTRRCMSCVRWCRSMVSPFPVM